MGRLIDADAAIHALNVASRGDSKDVIRNLVICFLLASPTVDAEPIRHGKWIRDEFGTRCGACGLYVYRDKFGQPCESLYCPNCGAKMEREGV